MAKAEFNISWLALREAVSFVAHRFKYAEEYARVWIDREEKAGRLKSRRRTVKKRHLRATIYELCAYDLAAAGRLPTPRGEVAEGTRWTEAEAIAWAALGEPLSLRQWSSEMRGKIKPIQLEFRRQTGAGRVRAWGRPASEETLQQMPADLFRMSDYALVVQPHGNLGTEPPGELSRYQDRFENRSWRDACDIERDANEIMRVFPKLVPIPAAEWLTKLDAVITLETNRTDWTRLVELVAPVGGNPENSTQEANAIVWLVVGFDDLSARIDAKLHPALHEAEEIVRRVRDRSGEAVRAGQLVVKGRSVLNPTVPVTIPARLVAADWIWSRLLRSPELEIEGQHYVDMQIEPPEPPGNFADIETYGVERWLGELALALREESYQPDSVHETQRAEEPEEFVEHEVAPGPKPGGSPKQQAMCKAASDILNNDRRRPKPQGRNAAIARMLIKQKDFKFYKPATIEDYIRSGVREWEKANPGK